MAAEALLFPGQGSHADGMEAPYRGNALLERGLELLGHDPFARHGEGTRTQQPALFLCSLAAWDAAARPSAAAAAGHSLGEYAALVAAGVLEFDDAVALRPVRWRETVLALRDAGVERLVEFGPGRVLTGMVRRIVPEAVAA